MHFRTSIMKKIACTFLIASFAFLLKAQDAEQVFSRAKGLFDEKKNDEAIAVFKEYLDLFFHLEYDKAFAIIKPHLSVLPIEQINWVMSDVSGLFLRYKQSHDDEKAEKYRLEVINIIELVLVKDHPDYTNLLFDAGNIFQSIDDYDRAAKCFLELADVLGKTLGKDHPDYAYVLQCLGLVYFEMDAFEMAENYLLESMDIWVKARGRINADYISLLDHLGLLYLKTGNYEQAEKFFLEEKEIKDQELETGNSGYACLLNNLGRIYYAMGDKKQAEMYWWEAKGVWEKVFGKNLSDYDETINSLNLLYQDTNQDEIEMVFVRGGTMQLGCTPEQGGDCGRWNTPEYKATVGDFYIGKYEVTLAQWKAVMGKTPLANLGSAMYNHYPVTNVTFHEIQEFINKLNTMTGKQYRLPTEKEWEYAARGGAESKGYRYSGSNNADEVAWFKENSGGKTHPVGTKQPNELGIYDMSGNVHEWTSDWVKGRGRSSDRDRPQFDSDLVYRGGSWNDDVNNVRVSYFDCQSAPRRAEILGFRLACDSK